MSSINDRRRRRRRRCSEAIKRLTAIVCMSIRELRLRRRSTTSVLIVSTLYLFTAFIGSIPSI